MRKFLYLLFVCLIAEFDAALPEVQYDSLHEFNGVCAAFWGVHFNNFRSLRDNEDLMPYKEFKPFQYPYAAKLTYDEKSKMGHLPKKIHSKTVQKWRQSRKAKADEKFMKNQQKQFDNAPMQASFLQMMTPEKEEKEEMHCCFEKQYEQKKNGEDYSPVMVYHTDHNKKEIIDGVSMAMFSPTDVEFIRKHLHITTYRILTGRSEIGVMLKYTMPFKRTGYVPTAKFYRDQDKDAAETFWPHRGIEVTKLFTAVTAVSFVMEVLKARKAVPKTGSLQMEVALTDTKTEASFLQMNSGGLTKFGPDNAIRPAGEHADLNGYMNSRPPAPLVPATGDGTTNGDDPFLKKKKKKKRKKKRNEVDVLGDGQRILQTPSMSSVHLRPLRGSEADPDRQLILEQLLTGAVDETTLPEEEEEYPGRNEADGPKPSPKSTIMRNEFIRGELVGGINQRTLKEEHEDEEHEVDSAKSSPKSATLHIREAETKNKVNTKEGGKKEERKKKKAANQIKGDNLDFPRLLEIAYLYESAYREAKISFVAAGETDTDPSEEEKIEEEKKLLQRIDDALNTNPTHVKMVAVLTDGNQTKLVKSTTVFPIADRH
eukprot:Platyproteum_vivax@DN7578_c0_g1_i2.p1